MKNLLALICGVVLSSVGSLAGQSVFYQSTTGHESLEFGVVFHADTTVAQTFYATFPAVEVVDVAFTPPSSGVVELRLHEGSVGGPVVAVTRDFRLGAGEFARTRVVFSNAVPVMAGTFYWFELLMVVPPNSPGETGSFFNVAWHAESLGQTYINGVLRLGSAVEFGVGVFVPEILDPAARHVSYVEQQGYRALFPDAHLTNDYLTSFYQVRLRVKISGFDHSDHLRVEGATNGNVYYQGVLVGTTPTLPAGWWEIEVTFNAQASRAAVEDTLRRISYANLANEPPDYTRTLTITLWGNAGTMDTEATLDYVPVNDAPVPQITGLNLGRFWPDTNLFAFARPREEAQVFMEGVESTDPDQDVPRKYDWTCAEQADWISHEPVLSHLFNFGTNHLTLRVNDGQLTNSTTVAFKVISVGQGIQRLKKVVRANTQRSDRIKLLKELQAALTQFRRNNRYPARIHLETFASLMIQVPSEARDSALECAWAIRLAIIR